MKNSVVKRHGVLKVVSILLMLVMLFTAFPLSVFGNTYAGDVFGSLKIVEKQSSGKYSYTIVGKNVKYDAIFSLAEFAANKNYRFSVDMPGTYKGEASYLTDAKDKYAIAYRGGKVYIINTALKELRAYDKVIYAGRGYVIFEKSGTYTAVKFDGKSISDAASGDKLSDISEKLKLYFFIGSNFYYGKFIPENDGYGFYLYSNGVEVVRLDSEYKMDPRVPIVNGKLFIYKRLSVSSGVGADTIVSKETVIYYKLDTDGKPSKLFERDSRNGDLIGISGDWLHFLNEDKIYEFYNYKTKKSVSLKVGGNITRVNAERSRTGQVLDRAYVTERDSVVQTSYNFDPKKGTLTKEKK